MRVYCETERLVLREFTRADVDDLVELNSDPEVMKYLNGGRPIPRDEIEHRYLPHYLSFHRHTPDRGFFAAQLTETGEFIGTFVLRDHDNDSTTLDIGWRLRRAAWGKGYATEGARALVEKGFADLGASRIRAETMTVNVRSRSVMEKIGLRFVRTFFQDWPDVIEGSDQGDVEYALTRAEWAEVTRAARSR